MEESLVVSDPQAFIVAAAARAVVGAGAHVPRSRVAWQQPEELPGVEILVVDHRAGRWRMFHDGYAICTPIRLSRSLEWRGASGASRQGVDALILIEPAQVHAVGAAAPATFRLLTLERTVLERAAAELGRRLSPRAGAVVVGGPGTRAFARLHYALENASSALERESHFAACLRMLLDHWTGRASPYPDVEHAGVLRAREYLEEHLAEPVTLETLAATAGMSRFHLLRAFARRYGAPPHAFQLALRVAAARKQLRAGTRASEVALQLGFADQSHLSRHFRSSLGVTPTAYAAEVRAKK